MTSHSSRPHQPSTPAPARYEPGDVVLGRYRLEAPIGFGGMGTVWRAHNESLDSLLALKLIRDTGSWPASGADRLLVEAKTTASLRHPAIIRVFDFGHTEQGDSFIAMELLAGESLRHQLDTSGPLQATDAVRVLLPILAGLGCAHARGIIHRDLKPDNIFLARDDADGIQPKILDFGIAMCEGSVSRLTTAGVLLGSPSYMSPEQALGKEDLDLRVDLWGLAVVLYEAIAGRTPWQARSCPVLLRAIVDDEAPALIGTGGVDAELWAILLKGLAKQRENRWPTARAFGEALATWLINNGVTDDITGASLRSVWLGHQSGDIRPSVRPSLRSIPPSCTAPTVEKTTRNLTKRRALHPTQNRWSIGVIAAVAATLLLWGGRARTDAAATAEGPYATAAAQVGGASSASSALHAPAAAYEPMNEAASLANTGTPRPSAELSHGESSFGRDGERAVETIAARPVRRAPKQPTVAQPVLAAPPPRMIAREMDFGF